MRQAILSLLTIILISAYSCSKSDEYKMEEVVKATPYGIIDSTNLFSEEKLDSIRYYIVNPYNEDKIESLYEKAVRHSLSNNTTVIRVDSMKDANMIIKL